MQRLLAVEWNLVTGHAISVALGRSGTLGHSREPLRFVGEGLCVLRTDNISPQGKDI